MAKTSGMGDMGGVVKYAAIGAAIYFGYRWAVGEGMIPDYVGLASDVAPISNGGQVPITNTTGQTPGQQNDAGQQVGSNTVGGGQSGGGNVKDQVWQAAKGEATANGGELHFWQWNFYLPANLPAVDPFAVPESLWQATKLGRKPLGVDDVQNTPLTIDQWWAMVKGPMGLGRVNGNGMAGVNWWGQQASLYEGGN
jgi:hypothetical protein